MHSRILTYLLVAFVSGFLAACDGAVDTDALPVPEIVSATDSADVDDPIQLIVRIPGDINATKLYTLIIDWGDGRPAYIATSVESAFQTIYSYSYLDAGTYSIRCRATLGEGRVSAWSDVHTVQIGGAPLIGRGDWWMFMRDAIHSGHSMFAGPAQPRLLWKQSFTSPLYSSPAFDRRGTMHLGSDAFVLTAMYPDSRQKWIFGTGTGQIRSSPLLLDDGTIFFGSNSANVYAVNRRGSALWSSSVSAPIGLSSPTPLTGGGFVIGCTDGQLHAFTTGGTPRWTILTSGSISGSPAVARDGTVYIGSHDQILYAISDAGLVLWTRPTEAAITGSPSIAADGSIVFGNTAGWLYSLRNDGRLNWRRDLHAPIHSTPAASREGRILCVIANGDLVSLDLNGDEQWRASIGQTAASVSPILDVHGVAYVSGPDGALTAYDRDGRLLWRYETDGVITSTPAIGQQGQLVFGNDKGWLFVLGE